MAYDGGSHSFQPTPTVVHRPEHPYVGLESILRTVYAHSQESARILLVRPWPYAKRRSEATWLFDYLVQSEWVDLYDGDGVLIPRPCGSVTALLAFRPGTDTTVSLRLTVGGSTSDEATETVSGGTVYDPMDRDATPQQVVAATLDTSEADLSSSVALRVEAKATTPILPEWLIVFRTA